MIRRIWKGSVPTVQIGCDPHFIALQSAYNKRLLWIMPLVEGKVSSSALFLFDPFYIQCVYIFRATLFRLMAWGICLFSLSSLSLWWLILFSFFAFPRVLHLPGSSGLSSSLASLDSCRVPWSEGSTYIIHIWWPCFNLKRVFLSV